MRKMFSKHNPLLIKDEIGKAKPSVYDLPAFGHAYGVGSEEADFEGAREITSSWATHVPSVAKKSNTIDYVKFNKSAASKFSDSAYGSKYSKALASAGTTGGSEMANNVNVVNVTGGAKSTRSGTTAHALPSDIDPNFAFGKANRPSTPVGVTLSNKEGMEFEKQAKAKQAAILAERRKKFVPAGTKAAAGHAAGAQAKLASFNVPPVTDEWRLSKFRNVKPTFKLPDRNKELAAAAAAKQAAAEEAAYAAADAAKPEED